jgi:hypothetical protein
LVAAINQAASDINVSSLFHFYFIPFLTGPSFHQNISPSPINEDDGEAIISQVQGIQPIIIDALNGIVSLKSEFDSCQGLDVSDLIVVDLQDLSSATSALETALIAAVPVRFTSVVNKFTLNDIHRLTFKTAPPLFRPR